MLTVKFWVRIPVGSPYRLIHGTFRAVFEMAAESSKHNLIKIGKRKYRNPIYLAKEWRRVLDKGEYSSSFALARHLGVSRARVTQMLNLLKLSHSVMAIIKGLGDPLPNKHLCERKLRPLLGLPEEDQIAMVRSMFGLTV